MTTAVAPLPQVFEPNDSSALARKRRREILSSQRILPDLPTSSPPCEEPSLKRRKVTHVEVSEESDNSDAKPSRKKVAAKKKKTTKKGKKPQMKYDPDVPMTKEEAAVWRREQRRKRNRESAAASRQRQRDRITELEGEVDEWKTKFDGIIARISELEQVTQMNVTDDLMADIAALPAQSVVSPASSPNLTPQSPTVSPVASCSLFDAGKIKTEFDLQAVHQIQEESSEEQLLNKMISRPAVKITGAATSLLPEESMMLPADLCPDPCVSSSETELEQDVVEELETTQPLLLPNLEDEFGEFLLDACTWL